MATTPSSSRDPHFGKVSSSNEYLTGNEASNLEARVGQQFQEIQVGAQETSSETNLQQMMADEGERLFSLLARIKHATSENVESTISIIADSIERIREKIHSPANTSSTEEASQSSQLTQLQELDQESSDYTAALRSALGMTEQAKKKDAAKQPNLENFLLELLLTTYCPEPGTDITVEYNNALEMVQKMTEAGGIGLDDSGKVKLLSATAKGANQKRSQEAKIAFCKLLYLALTNEDGTLLQTLLTTKWAQNVIEAHHESLPSLPILPYKYFVSQHEQYKKELSAELKQFTEEMKKEIKSRINEIESELNNLKSEINKTPESEKVNIEKKIALLTGELAQQNKLLKNIKREASISFKRKIAEEETEKLNKSKEKLNNDIAQIKVDLTAKRITLQQAQAKAHLAAIPHYQLVAMMTELKQETCDDVIAATGSFLMRLTPEGRKMRKEWRTQLTPSSMELKYNSLMSQNKRIMSIILQDAFLDFKIAARKTT